MQDLRNHGESPHDARHDYIAMVEDVEAFIAEQRLEQPTLIGHSMLVTVLGKTSGMVLTFLLFLGVRKLPWF